MPPEKVVNYAGQPAQFERSRCATGGGVFNYAPINLYTTKRKSYNKADAFPPQ